jgi:D-alanine-D-alanine ligase
MRTRVAVIYGGRSGEHEVSLRSAKSIIEAMDTEKYNVLHYLISKEGKWSPRPIVPEPNGNPEIDVVFPALHGTFGEDGTMQGLLELANLPYVGAGVLASSLSMDKEMMKRVAAARGLPVVDYFVVPECGSFEFDLDFPKFVKPANLGSSVGISKVQNEQELMAAIELARSYDRKVIVERGITGREFECAVLGNESPVASVPCEILPSRDFYDYEDKYILDKAQTVLPASLSPEKTAELQGLAVGCYRAVECEGMARVDFLLESATDRLYINEINTIPGFTSISMYPKMWEYSGLPMPQLIDRLIELAFSRHEAKKRLQYSK